MVPNGYTSKHPAPYWSNPPFFNFWHSGSLALSPERQRARMSKIKNGGLDQYGPERFGRLISPQSEKCGTERVKRSHTGNTRGNNALNCCRQRRISPFHTELSITPLLVHFTLKLDRSTDHSKDCCWKPSLDCFHRHWNRFYHATPFMSGICYDHSVRLSVCLSVSAVIPVKAAKYVSTLVSPSSTIISG